MDDYDKIINLISPKEKQKALDAPSGQGQITKLLLEKGLSVDCLDDEVKDIHLSELNIKMFGSIICFYPDSVNI
jgi:hypothetical protein